MLVSRLESVGNPPLRGLPTTNMGGRPESPRFSGRFTSAKGLAGELVGPLHIALFGDELAELDEAVAELR